MQAKMQTRRMTRARSWRSALGLLLLLTFSVQTFLVQTHLHFAPLAAVSIHGMSVSAPHQTKAPLDADKCLLCHAFVHAGTYVTPAVAAVLPPTAAVTLIAFSAGTQIPERLPSHSWMGRAPPHA